MAVLCRQGNGDSNCGSDSFSVYGENAIRGQQPYQVTLKDGQWAVDGTVRPGFVGGRFTSLFSNCDARVVEIGYQF